MTNSTIHTLSIRMKFDWHDCHKQYYIFILCILIFLDSFLHGTENDVVQLYSESGRTRGWRRKRGETAEPTLSQLSQVSVQCTPGGAGRSVYIVTLLVSVQWETAWSEHNTDLSHWSNHAESETFQHNVTREMQSRAGHVTMTRNFGRGPGPGPGTQRKLFLCFLLILVELTQISCNSEIHSEETSALEFTRDVYNATVQENSVGKVYVVSSEKMGIFSDDPSVSIKYKIVSGDSENFFKAEAEKVGDFIFLMVRTRTSNVNVLNRERVDR